MAFPLIFLLSLLKTIFINVDKILIDILLALKLITIPMKLITDDLYEF